ncbi:hypothetical protein Y1Q_0000832 [Alligator mississippiensis]|uniref:Uncharacterized protein n=1 Tax=Alligator mississippiensis TaxID=8496 RepID=A0A151MW54_ALLMI|nr:hypothetical protein Y1Q_0000832 [Alligator mississippiensis]
MQSWAWGHGVETCTEAVTLAEGFQLEPAEDKKLQVPVNVMVEEVSSDEVQEPVDCNGEQPKAHSADMPLEEAGQTEMLGPQDKPPLVPEEPLHCQESDGGLRTAREQGRVRESSLINARWLLEHASPWTHQSCGIE